MLDGYKKFTVTLLTFGLVLFKMIFGKDLGIDVNTTTEALFVVIGAVYMIVQAIHDIFKEKAKK